MLNEKMIKGLEGKGFKRWTKGDMDRLYINVETLGFEMKYNSRGNLYKVERDGASYRGDEAEAIKNAKIYIDVATGDIHVSTYAMGNNREILNMLETEARAIYETAAEETEQADAVETAETAEDAETAETPAMKWDKEQINRLEDAGFRLDEATGRMWLSYRALELEPIWYSMEFRGVTYTQAEVKALIAAAKRTYIDAYTGELHSDNAIIREAAEELMARAMMEFEEAQTV